MDNKTKYTIENMMRSMEERRNKVSKFITENSDKLGREVNQIESEIKLFNKIGCEAIKKGFNPVFFKTKKVYEHGSDLKLVDVHYIHIYKEEDLNISIFYDKYGTILSSRKYAHYEIYDMKNVEVFSDTSKDELNLFNKTMSLL